MNSISQTNSDTAIFLPFYGEFGWFLNSYIRLIHYYIAQEKIVCCRRGEEVYFPSAKSFFYDWQDMFTDEEKCGFRNTWPISPMFTATQIEIELDKKLSLQYPTAEIVRFDYAIPPELVQYFPVPIKAERRYKLVPDIVICARQRNAMGTFGDKGVRNYNYWPQIVKPLLAHGFTIGIIGRQETSYDLPEIQFRSWEYENNAVAIFEMLQNTKLYIGTDTGPTHLAALFKTPMVLFRNNHEKLSPNMLKKSILPIARREGFFAEIVGEGWDNPTAVVKAVLKVLQK